jgi:hypothetical protein
VASTNAGVTSSETHGTTSPVSGSAPTDATDGQPIQNLGAITVVVDSAITRTLSGAGTLDCYLYDPSVALWARFPAGDFNVTATTRMQAFEPVDVVGPRKGARIKWIPTGVTFSAGSAGVTVWQLGGLSTVQSRFDR